MSTKAGATATNSSSAFAALASIDVAALTTPKKASVEAAAEQLAAAAVVLREARTAGQLGVALEAEVMNLRAEALMSRAALQALEREASELRAAAKGGEVGELAREVARLQAELKERDERDERRKRGGDKAVERLALRENRREEQLQQLQWENAHLANSLRALEARAGTAAAAANAPASSSTSSAAGAPGKLQRSDSGFTLKRAALLAEEDRVLFEEAAAWVQSRLARTFANNDELLEALRSGVLLCDLLRGIDAKLVPTKVVASATGPGAVFTHMSNLNAFLDGCRRLGVPEYRLFAAADVVGPAPSKRKLHYCILGVARLAAQTYGVEPPAIVRMELDIERQRALPRPAAAVAIEAAADAARAAAAAAPAGSRSSSSSSSSAAAPSAPTSSSSSQSAGGAAGYKVVPDDAIDAEVTMLCEAFGVEQLSGGDLPVRLQAGEYKIGNSIVHIRLVRGTPLVYHRDEWRELGSFLHEFLAQQRRSRGVNGSEEKSSSSAPAATTSAGAASPAKATSAGSTGTSGGTSTSSGGSGGHSTSIGTDSAPRSDVSAYKEFFFLTALSVKLSHALREENIDAVPTSLLYERAAQHDVPFHQFSSWIDTELTKMYLAGEVGRRRPGDSSGDLRAQRRAQMGALRSRPATRTRAVTGTEDDSPNQSDGEAEDSWFSGWW